MIRAGCLENSRAARLELVDNLKEQNVIFIGGMQPKTVRVRKLPHGCFNCSHFELYEKRIDHYLSLFFIPLIRVKKGPLFTACEQCGTVSDQGNTCGGGGFSFFKRKQQCGSCRREVESGFQYCPHCGRQL